MRLLYVLSVIIFFFTAHADGPALQINDICLLGSKQIDQNVLLISKGNKSNEVNLTLIDSTTTVKWELTLITPKLKGYHFNKVQILHTSEYIYWVSQLDHTASVQLIQISDGLMVQTVPLAKNLHANSNPVQVACNNESFWFFEKDGNEIIAYKLGDKGLGKHHSGADIKEPWNTSSFNAIKFQDNALYSGAYVISKNHRTIDILLQKKNLVTGDTLSNHVEIELSSSSYTYNSTVDYSLLKFVEAKDGFYALGKLDHPFENKYPKRKLTEAITGVWIAKFDNELNLQYINELSFKKFQGLVTNNQTTKPTVISITDCLNGTTLVNVNELREVLYGKKYVITLDTKGEEKSFIGGQDNYHFFEYNEKGLRHGAKKTHIRIFNDDWNQYKTASLHQMNYVNRLHSIELAIIKNKAESNHHTISEQCYTFMGMGDRVLILQYLDKKAGQLNIYEFKKP